MAKQLHGHKLWLHSDFLSHDFFLEGAAKRGEDAHHAGLHFDENEDEDDLLVAGLAQQMARYFLPDDDDEAAPEQAKAMARSPQSTLCAWSASNKGSPNSPSRVSSPPPPPLLEQRGKDDPRDLLYEAADQVMRLRQLADLGRRQGLCYRGVLGPPSPAVYAAPETIDDVYCASGRVLTHQQLQTAHFYHLKRQQAMKQQLSAAWGSQSKARGGGRGCGEGRGGRPLDLPPSAWPPLRKPPPSQQPPPPPQPVSGMRSAFLNSSSGRKESIGTGVFIPRVAANKLEPRKKTTRSSELAPKRVVQAMNLNLDEYALQPHFPSNTLLRQDALMDRNSTVLSLHNMNHHFRSQPTTAVAAAAAATHEFGLPQEWTY